MVSQATTSGALVNQQEANTRSKKLDERQMFFNGTITLDV